MRPVSKLDIAGAPRSTPIQGLLLVVVRQPDLRFLDGSFSAVSTPIIATKVPLESARGARLSGKKEKTEMPKCGHLELSRKNITRSGSL